MREHAPAVARQLRDSEAKIQSQSYETSVTIDDEGLVVFEKDGTANRVELTAPEQAVMYDRVVAHNHPSSQSFSLDDVELASSARVREMRAVGQDGTVYRIQSGRGATWPNEERIKDAALAENTAVRNEISRAVQRGELTPSEGQREHNHRIWDALRPGWG